MYPCEGTIASVPTCGHHSQCIHVPMCRHHSQCYLVVINKLKTAVVSCVHIEIEVEGVCDMCEWVVAVHACGCHPLALACVCVCVCVCVCLIYVCTYIYAYILCVYVLSSFRCFVMIAWYNPSPPSPPHTHTVGFQVELVVFTVGNTSKTHQYGKYVSLNTEDCKHIR